jgi:hypothetical protein
VTAPVSVFVQNLAEFMDHPQCRDDGHFQPLDPLFVLHSDPPAPDALGRWQTLICIKNEFTLLVDEFRAEKPEPFHLTLESNLPLSGGKLRYESADDVGPLGLHFLGDYMMDRQSHKIDVVQNLTHSRFMIAVTRDPVAIVRPLNGWAIEVRSKGHVYHLQHSNRSKKLRPLGPFQTDARFAVADWAEAAPHEAHMNVLDPQPQRGDIQ